MKAGAILLVALLLAPAAEAHTRATSYSSWTLTDAGAEVRARVTQLELTRLALDPQLTPDYAGRAGRLLAQRLELARGGTPCTSGPVAAHAGSDGWLHARWSVACAADGADELRSGFLTDAAPGHLHFARVRTSDGRTVERVLTAAEPVLAVPAALDGSFARYVALGVEHILGGWDHLAFVLALLLLAATLREIALLATGFTVAHSLTLAAAVLGWVRPDAPRLEAVIGFTVALVALEALWLRAGRARWMPAALVLLVAALAIRLPAVLAAGLALFAACYFALLGRLERPARLRAAMALLFGLVHGFGFAGALLVLELPPQRLAAGLLGFNVGVELGQLLVIAVAWPLLRLLERRPRAVAIAHESVAAMLCGLGVYWLVVRSFIEGVP